MTKGFDLRLSISQSSDFTYPPVPHEEDSDRCLHLDGDPFEENAICFDPDRMAELRGKKPPEYICD